MHWAGEGECVSQHALDRGGGCLPRGVLASGGCLQKGLSAQGSGPGGKYFHSISFRSCTIMSILSTLCITGKLVERDKII